MRRLVKRNADAPKQGVDKDAKPQPQKDQRSVHAPRALHFRRPNGLVGLAHVAILLLTVFAATVEAQLPHNIPDFSQRPGGCHLVASGQTYQLPNSPVPCVQVQSGGVAVLPHLGDAQVGTLQVLEGGTFRASGTARLTILNQPLDTTFDPEQYGTGLLLFGTVSLVGDGHEKTDFCRVAVEPVAGAQSVTLACIGTGWQAGDEVFVPDTRQVPENDKFNPNYALQHEQRRITAVSESAGTTTVSLDAPLSFAHLGARDANGQPTVLADGTKLLPHVANLTRGIVIRSENPNGTRGHILATHRATVDIRGVRIEDMGRTQAIPLDSTTFSNGIVQRIGTNQIGRYPLHLHHLMGPVNPTNTGDQFTVSDNVIVNALKWPLAIHRSHFGRIAQNVIVGGPRLTGAGLALEDGSETENLIAWNFVADIRGHLNSRMSGSDTTTPGSGGECFWAAGFNNRFVGNVAAGCRNAFQGIVSGVGFKFFTPAAPSASSVRNPLFRGADLSSQTETVEVIAQRQPILQFEGNEAYGLIADGLTVWQLGTDGYQVYSGQAESLITNFRTWNAYEGAVWLYPVNRVTLDGLVYRYTPAVTLYHPPAITSGDYRNVNLTVRGGDIHAAHVVAGAIDPVGTWRFENVKATTRGHAFVPETPATPGTQASRSGLSIEWAIVNPQITTWPGQSGGVIQMFHNTRWGSAMHTAEPYTVTLTEGASTSRVWFREQATQVIYGAQAPSDATASRSDIDGLVSGGSAPPPPPPPPVDCVVSEWGAWSAWTDNGDGTESRTRTRTIVTEPSNGGAACPALTETETRPIAEEPPPPPPPPDVCADTPLLVNVTRWPSGQTGAKSGTWNSGSFVLVDAGFRWNPLRFVAVDTRGCAVTVQR